MVLSLDRWRGKVAIVTGASSGIGASIVDHLVENGLIVVGLARRSEKIEERAKQLSDKSGKLYAIKTDMRNENEILEAFQWIEKKLGHVHILINNAGVWKGGSLHQSDTESWRATLEVNILGLSIATREAIGIMIKNGIKGHIIHINSIVGRTLPNYPIMNIYPATKHAVTALTGVLRHEMDAIGAKIKVTSLNPGLVTTEMTSLNKEMDEENQRLLNSLPILDPENIAEAVCYVLSTPENVQIRELTITPLGEKICL